jgi:hypothetical protein
MRIQSLLCSSELSFRSWPRAGTPSIDFVATLPTAGLHLQRLLWSRQIEQSSGWTQSEAAVQLGRAAGGNAAKGAGGEYPVSGSPVE